MDKKIEAIKKLIINKVYVTNKDEQIGHHSDDNHWIFDFRRVLMQAEVMDTVGEIF